MCYLTQHFCVAKMVERRHINRSGSVARISLKTLKKTASSNYWVELSTGYIR
jgi:hypothetical protein